MQGWRVSGRAGFQPAVLGILPGTSGATGASSRDMRPAKLPFEWFGGLRRMNAFPRPNGPGRIPGPAGKIPALPEHTHVTRAFFPRHSAAAAMAMRCGILDARMMAAIHVSTEIVTISSISPRDECVAERTLMRMV